MTDPVVHRVGYDAAGFEVWQFAPGWVVGAADEETAHRYAEIVRTKGRGKVGMRTPEYVRKFGPFTKEKR